MSSSGLIYAVIVGAWAAYLVPMWLRRQDELNEARPTERFSTAIRLLSGRAAMERKVSRHREDDAPAEASAAKPAAGAGSSPRQQQRQTAPPAPAPTSVPTPGTGPAAAAADRRAGTQRSEAQQRRASLLARRRRMVILLFAVFTLGMIAAAVGGVALLWAPAIPAVLFSVYIAHLRRQERRRFEVKIDRRRAAEAAQRVRERERDRRRAAAVPETQAVSAPPPPAAQPTGRTSSGSGLHHTRALVEAAAAAEESEDWHDGPRDHSGDPEGWDPVPVPLPTYVTAPVAPRRTGGLDLGAPDTWSAGRAVVPPPQPHLQPQQPPAPGQRRPPSTPLFDQYADEPAPHPRAANE
ncbi:gephyrin-like molybdotransferase receptor GlpR [Streptacidiphilus sp. EB103A]|uniref:divisome protein SepX/GlpR n=1 Tax=Streptacidiphilus sp. EB103A TaxID=3156275 RepID=UPI0035119065